MDTPLCNHCLCLIIYRQKTINFINVQDKYIKIYNSRHDFLFFFFNLPCLPVVNDVNSSPYSNTINKKFKISTMIANM